MAEIIKFVIGDWSCDGHGHYAEYLVESNKPVTDVREAHFKENKAIGKIESEMFKDTYVCDIYKIINNHSKNPLEDLRKIILEIKDLVEFNYDCEKESIDYDDPDLIEKILFSISEEAENKILTNFYGSEGKSVLIVWLNLLMLIDPTLDLKIVSHALSYNEVKYKGYPMEHKETMQFYGVDAQSRHLEAPGYGVWEGDEYEFSSPV